MKNSNFWLERLSFFARAEREQKIGQKQKPNSTFSLLSMDTVPTKESVVPPQSDELHESLNIDITLFESQSEPHLSKSTPPNILEVAQKISESDFEFKSASIYNKVYEEYTSWLKARNVSPDYVSSNCLLAYLYHLRTVLSAPTIISRMSMIKAKIMKLYNRNIFQEFPKLMMEMKKMNEKHTKKKASTFSQEELCHLLQIGGDRNTVGEIQIAATKDNRPFYGLWRTSCWGNI